FFRDGYSESGTSFSSTEDHLNSAFDVRRSAFGVFFFIFYPPRFSNRSFTSCGSDDCDTQDIALLASVLAQLLTIDSIWLLRVASLPIVCAHSTADWGSFVEICLGY